MAIIESLKQSELFSHLGQDYLARISPWCCGETFSEGATIFKEGDKAEQLYVLTEGMVALEMEVRPIPERPGLPVAVEVVSKGEVFGWSSLVEPNIYTMTARCMVPSTILAINGSLFLKVMKSDPDLGFEVMKRLSQVIATRLANTRYRLTTGAGLALLTGQLGTSQVIPR